MSALERKQTVNSALDMLKNAYLIVSGMNFINGEPPRATELRDELVHLIEAASVHAEMWVGWEKEKLS